MPEGRTHAFRQPSAAHTETARLVLAAQSGDVRARDELVAAHLPLVYNIVGRALPASCDVDDVVQNTMLHVVRGLPGLRDPARFRS
ncbi:RNA polymerase sigma factor [Streptomyces sp. NPDC059785]